jgi:hypothetical protein
MDTDYVMHSVGRWNKKSQTNEQQSQGHKDQPTTSRSEPFTFMTAKHDLREQDKTFDSFACVSLFRDTKRAFSLCTERLITSLAVYPPPLC